MLVDVFAFMRSVSKKINEVIDAAYPDNKLSEGRAPHALSTVNGMILSVQAVIENKIADVESKGQKFRSITDDGESDPPLDFESSVRVENLSVDYYRMFSKYVDEITIQLEFQRKNSGALHSTLQRIRGVNSMMNHFLESLEKK